LSRDAADTLAQRRTTNAQAFRIYNTFTSDTNHERGFLRWSSNVFQIGTEKGSGGGTARDLVFQTDGTTRMTIGGTSNAVTCTGSLSIVSSLSFQGNSSIVGNIASGVIRLLNAAQNGFDRIQFGGSTTSFPALKRDSTALQVRLANDSDFAPLACGALTINGNLDASTRDIVTDTTTGTKIGTATTQKIGFFNATPVVQPSSTGLGTSGFTSGGGGNFVHAGSTFTGNVGSTAYTLSDIVAHLKNLGLIAV
jgi:hypothetical protein